MTCCPVAYNALSHRPKGKALSSALLSAASLLVVCCGCDPPPLTDNGVLYSFGGVGLGPGHFSYPRPIAAEPNGSIFVIDKAGRVQRFSQDGQFELGWTMPDTRKGVPTGLCVHPDGRLFIADTHCHRVSVFTRDGGLLTTFGREGTGDGEMFLPTDVAVDADGFVYVGECQENDRITKWSPDLRFITAFGNEPIEGKRLSRPAGLAFDREQTLWVSDACNHRVVRFSRAGQVLTVFGEFGGQPGQMRYPYDIGVDADDRIMVCEREGNRLQWFDKTGRSLKTWGSSGRHVGQLFSPWGAAIGKGGRVYVVDSLNSRVQAIAP